MDNVQAQELAQRIRETLEQAQPDGLISGDDDDAASVVSGWVLIFESTAADSRWLHRVHADGMFPWQWRGYLHEALR